MTLPAGFAVRLSSRTGVCDGGRSPVGGSRGSVLYLSDVAAGLLDSAGVVHADPGAAGALAVAARSRVRRAVVAGGTRPRHGGHRRHRRRARARPRPRPRAAARRAASFRAGDRGRRRIPGPVGHCPGDGRSRGPPRGARREPRTRRGSQHRAAPRRHPRSSRSATPTWCPIRAGWPPCDATSTTPTRPSSHRVCSARRAGRATVGSPATSRRAPPSTSARSRRPSGNRGVVAYLPSACLLARVSVAARAGGFDAALRCGEDVDSVWRLLASGAGVRCMNPPPPSATATARDCASGWACKAFYGTSAAPLAARHGAAVAPLVVTPRSAVFAVALLAQRRWSVPVAPAAASVATAGTARRLGRSQRPVRAAAVLTLEGSVAVAWQTSSALTRHYWPLAALAATRSRRARRALVVAAVVEGLADRRRVGADLDPVRYVLARRLDDLAYGSGVWFGALREHSLRALAPDLRRMRRRATL
ncbi:hypothetical protein LP418_15350 [Nocardioides sp. B-3]|nr:hypothetical protein [Nocardioides sp. B-3]UUZ57780.1 hypothetical protein LP418_15350 [Nocardioides sp. B-3]